MGFRRCDRRARLGKRGRSFATNAPEFVPPQTVRHGAVDQTTAGRRRARTNSALGQKRTSPSNLSKPPPEPVHHQGRTPVACRLWTQADIRPQSRCSYCPAKRTLLSLKAKPYNLFIAFAMYLGCVPVDLLLKVHAPFWAGVLCRPGGTLGLARFAYAFHQR